MVRLGGRLGLGTLFGGSREGRRLRQVLPWSFGGGLALVIAGAAALATRQDEKNLAILTAEEPALLLSPFKDAAPVSAPAPHPGQAVIHGEVHGEWVHLSIPGTGTAGWAPVRDVALLIPPPAGTSGK